MDDPVQRLPLDKFLEAVRDLLEVFHHLGLLVINILEIRAFVLDPVHHGIEHHIFAIESLHVLMERFGVQFENNHLQSLHHLLEVLVALSHEVWHQLVDSLLGVVALGLFPELLDLVVPQIHVLANHVHVNLQLQLQ